MASIQTNTSNTLTWDNPYGGSSYAVITNGTLIEFVVMGQNGQNTVYTIDPAIVTHLKTVFADLDAYLNPVLP